MGGDEQQVSQAKRRCKKKDIIPGVQNADDELSIVLQKACMEDGSRKFIREVKTLHEPAIIVARDRQLIDLIRFCTLQEQFGVMTVDPTFSLGEFDVTVITYRHLLLECMAIAQFLLDLLWYTTRRHFLHTHFLLLLWWDCSLLSELKCFGTDGGRSTL